MVIPYLGAYIAKKGNFPPDYFFFPPYEVSKAGPNSLVLGITLIFFFLSILLFGFPQVFGFKKTSLQKPFFRAQGKFPYWFWIGCFLWAIGFFSFAAKLSEPKWLTNWAFLPICWGFILMLDGLVYRIDDGNSLINKNFKEFLGMAFSSIPGWLIYEYLNFFIEHNWYYPAAKLMDRKVYFLYAALGSSAFIPMSFEWYQLLNKIKILNLKYKFGPKVVYSKNTSILLIILGFVILFVTPFLSDHIFYGIWIAPVLILSCVLRLLGEKTPFTPIKENGDWSFLLIFALTWLAQGFIIEAWNWFSGFPVDQERMSYNPAFWRYCIPFVKIFHIFEMPILGYMGYFLFSIHCWLWWTIISKIFAPSLNYSLGDEFV